MNKDEIEKIKEMSKLQYTDTMIRAMIYSEISGLNRVQNMKDEELFSVIEIGRDIYSSYDYATPTGVGVALCNYIYGLKDDESININDFEDEYQMSDWK